MDEIVPTVWIFCRANGAVFAIKMSLLSSFCHTCVSHLNGSRYRNTLCITPQNDVSCFLTPNVAILHLRLRPELSALNRSSPHSVSTAKIGPISRHMSETVQDSRLLFTQKVAHGRLSSGTETGDRERRNGRYFTEFARPSCQLGPRHSGSSETHDIVCAKQQPSQSSSRRRWMIYGDFSEITERVR